MYKIILLLFFINVILTPYKIESQNLTYGTTINLGISKITSDLPKSGDYKNKFAISGNAGGFIERKIGNNALGLEFLWVQIESIEETKNRVLRESNGQEIIDIGIVDDIQRSNNSYLGLPIYYRIQTGKLGLKLGIQSMIFLFASEKFKVNGEINGAPYEAESKIKNVKYNRLDFGPKVGIDFTINNKLRLRSDFYYGFSDITLEKRFLFERKNRQITMGISYLMNKEE